MTGLFLVAIVVVSTLLFGAVEEWAIAIVGIVTAVAFIAFVRKWDRFPLSPTLPPGADRDPDADSYVNPDPKRLLILTAALFAYGLFQLVPLPTVLLKAIHPALKTLLALPTLPAPDAASAQPIASLPMFHSISVYPFATELELAHVAIYLMVFLMAAFGFHDKEDVRILIRMLVFFGFILAIFAIVQRATWNEKIYWFSAISNPRAQPFGPFVNKNHYAGWINMIFPFALAAGFTAATLDRKIRYLLYGLAMAVTVFFSLSRGGVMAFFAGVFVFCLFVLSAKTSRRRFIPILLFVAVLIAFLAYLGVSPLLERFSQLDIPHHERVTVWKATLGAFLDFPVFGSGIGTYGHAFKLYHPATWYFYDMAHNDYVQLLMEAGVVGTALVTAFIILVLKIFVSSEWTERETYLKGAFFASFTTIAFHSIMDFNLHIPSNAILLALLAGLSVSLSRLNEE